MSINNSKGSLKRDITNNSRKRQKKERPEKYPIFLSAAVYPGAGQIFQHRLIAGLFFAISFTIMFLAFIFIMGSIILEFYSLGFDFNETHVNSDPPLALALTSFFITMLIYIINIIDTHAAYRRQLHATNLQDPNDLASLVNKISLD